MKKILEHIICKKEDIFPSKIIKQHRSNLGLPIYKIKISEDLFIAFVIIGILNVMPSTSYFLNRLCDKIGKNPFWALIDIPLFLIILKIANYLNNRKKQEDNDSKKN